jgi:hypothetical protein
MWSCQQCHAILAFEGQRQVRLMLRRKGLPADLCTWICCAYGLDGQYLPQLRQRWAMGPLMTALRGYPPADRHLFRPQDFPPE